MELTETGYSRSVDHGGRVYIAQVEASLGRWLQMVGQECRVKRYVPFYGCTFLFLGTGDFVAFVEDALME